MALFGWTWLKCIFLKIQNFISYCSWELSFTHWTCLSQNLFSFLFLLLLSAQHIVSKLNTSWGKRALLRAHERWPWAGGWLRFSGKFQILWRWQTAQGSPRKEERSRVHGSVPSLFPARGFCSPHSVLHGSGTGKEKLPLVNHWKCAALKACKCHIHGRRDQEKLAFFPFYTSFVLLFYSFFNENCDTEHSLSYIQSQILKSVRWWSPGLKWFWLFGDLEIWR